jgi:hypothetical protein
MTSNNILKPKEEEYLYVNELFVEKHVQKNKHVHTGVVTSDLPRSIKNADN